MVSTNVNHSKKGRNFLLSNELKFSTDMMMRNIVEALVKAFGIDTIQMLEDEPLETNNSLPSRRVDMLNTNLRKTVANENVDLHHFSRHGWTGILIIDKLHKRTFSLMTEATLKKVSKKGSTSKIPHYSWTLNTVENKDVVAPYRQMTMADYGFMEAKERFTEEDFLNDYSRITNDEILPTDGYRHYVIEYKAEGRDITKCSLKCLSPDYSVAQEASLMELVVPDISRLTDTDSIVEVQHKDQDIKNLMSVKAGVKKTYEREPDKGSVGTAIQMGEHKTS